MQLSRTLIQLKYLGTPDLLSVYKPLLKTKAARALWHANLLHYALFADGSLRDDAPRFINHCAE